MLARSAAKTDADSDAPRAMIDPSTLSTDYELVRRAIVFLTEQWNAQPDLDELAAAVGLTPTHCQKLFTRWCGLSPKAFLQAITIDHARRLLEGSASLMDVAHEVGLSGSSRLHDLFITHEAMTPGDYKRRGEGLELAFGFHATPFGTAVLVAAPRGLAGLAFVDEDAGQTQAEALEDLLRRWPRARAVGDASRTADYAARIFDPTQWRREAPLNVVMIGTDFEVRVWQTLLKIPMGRAASYADIARHLGQPTAFRAVGTAVGRNPISFVVPCHRVLRGDGNLGGYHWGLTRKRALIGWETGRVARS